MNGLKVTFPTCTLLFTETGGVADASDGTALGRWTAESANDAQRNCLIYDLRGALQPALRVHFRFNECNQLVVSVLPADGNVTAATDCTFTGGISIDDEHNVIYSITDGPGHETGQVVVLYGDLDFNGPAKLVLRLAGGGQTGITSDAQSPIGASQNLDVDKAGKDELTFHANTANTYGRTAQTIEHRPASIKLAGRWQLWPQGLAFACSAEGDLSNPSLVLSLKGRCKAVAAGLEFRLTDGDVSALFVVEGQHQFNAGSATWSLAIGYSQLADPKLRVQAAVKGKISYTNTAGNSFTIAGALSYHGDGGSTGELALGIDAEYTFKGGQLLVKASASWAGSKVQYDLQLSGVIKVAGGTLTFEVKYDSSNATSLTVVYAGSDADFLKNFNVSLTRDANGKVKAGISFSLKVTYVNDVPMITQA